MIILGIGCNIGDRLAYLREALTHLRELPEITVLKVSSVYESDALLPDNAPQTWDMPYLNLAVGISTVLQPKQLLLRTKTIEENMGRLQHLHWSPRIIDIDILAWHNEYLHGEIDIPHSELLKRPFALWPLADLVPDWQYCKPNSSATRKTALELGKKFGSRFTGSGFLHTRQIPQRIDTPIIMGIVNITPDSFSDGGEFIAPNAALTQAKNLFAAGAEVIDIGAESTRPGATQITASEEWRRLQPILDSWLSFWPTNKPKLSVDTHKPEILKKLLAYPIDFFNDVTGGTKPEILELLQNSTAKIIYMHNLGIPADPKNVVFGDIIDQVYQWGDQQLEKITKFGIAQERLIFDVGIGFGKTAEQSLTLIKNISRFRSLGVPLLVGHSRKSFLNLFTNQPFSARDPETAAVSEFLAPQVEYLRVHNVELTMRLLKIQAALR